jgi:GTP-binding protein YchF
MKLSIGIVGLPNVGKSTLFNLLTKQRVLAANYPFATIDPNVGVVPVPDERLEKLAEMSRSRKKIPAVVEFYDIAGLVKDAYKGEGLGNQFLSHIRETQAMVVVIRVFREESVVHVEKTVDPERDLEIINTELIFKDLETLEKKLVKTDSEARSGKKEAVQELAALRAVKAHLEAGKLPVASEEIMSLIRGNAGVRDLNLLTAKKQLYFLNGKEEEVSESLKRRIKELGADYIIADLAAIEHSNQEHTDQEHTDQEHTDKLEFVGMSSLIQKSYDILDLISFFTTGEDETRAWMIKRGTKAPQAAGEIHSDFEKKFIRAEVINWKELLEAGSWANARHKGLLRLEGKEYIVQDGDVMVIRHG